MTDLSARLSLPFLLPAQAQKHVTHNEALQRLDVTVQLVLEDIAAETPPALPLAGQVWALGAAPVAEWAGQAGNLAAYTGSDWLFVTPQPGWLAFDRSSDGIKIWSGTDWAEPAVPELSNLDGVGIGTSPDATNRLAVAATATLLSHDGAGHQIKVNKAAAPDTASLLFQTGWSGRAEMGTAGDDDFAIKLSVDGSAWITALRFAAADGAVSGAAVQQGPDDVTPGRLARADYAYGPGNILAPVSQSGGLPSGGVIEQGSNADGEYVRFADGTQICWVSDIDMGSILAAGSGTWTSPYRTDLVSLTWPRPFVAAPVASTTLVPGFAGVPLDGRGMVLSTYGGPTETNWLYLRAARLGGDAFDTNVLLSVSAVGRWI